MIKVKEVVDLPKGETKQTKYMLVYGTLRFGNGNWRNYLEGNSRHLLTEEFEGFRYMGGLSSRYTGLEEDSLVMDLFEINDDVLVPTNRLVDSLEGVLLGFYGATLVTFEHPELGEIEAKFYRIESDRPAAGKDYILSFLKEGVSSETKEIIKEQAPSMYNFYMERNVFTESN